MRKQRVSTTCPWCGEVTLRLPCHANQKFCNRTCSNRYAWSRRPHKTAHVSCGTCDNMFLQTFVGQRFCSVKCGDEGRKAAARVWLKCAHCGDDYWRHRGRGSRSTYCSRECQNLAGAARRAAREMSPEEYASRLTAQGGVCAICKRPDGRLSLARDHCHRTGAWRGLLCGRCNKGLGLFKDSPELLRVAALYIERGGVSLVSVIEEGVASAI